MPNLRTILKRLFVYFTVASLMLWTAGTPLDFSAKPARAAGGVTPEYLSNMEGMPIMLEATSTMYAVAEFNIYDIYAGHLAQLSVTVQDIPENTGFDPDVDLLPLSNTASSSGMSLWRDYDGDGVFDPGADKPAIYVSGSWTETASGWYANFNSINANSEFSFSASQNMKVFLVFQASRISTSSPKAFETIIEENGMYVSSAGIGYWPDMGDHYLEMPIFIGTAGAGGFGCPFVISEIQTAGGTTDDEFVEIYNRSPDVMSLGGWSLKYSPHTDSPSLSWSTILREFSTSSPPQVKAGGFFLTGYGNLSTTTDKTFTSGATLDETGGYIGLFNPLDEFMDWVGYGALSTSTLAEGGQPAYAPSATSSIERKAFHDSTYSMMMSGGIDEYSGNGQDSNNNALDFIIRSTSQPQNSTAPSEVPNFGTGGGGSDILINEVYYRPSTSGEGWIELFNRSDTSESIDGYKIKHKGWAEYTIPNIPDLAANDYLIIKWNQGEADNFVNGVDYDYLETGSSLGMHLDVYGGDIVLFASSSEISDYVEFGGSGYANESLAVADAQWMTGDYVPHVWYGESIGRKTTDGDDSNKSSDWQKFSTPSPGLPNMGADTTAPTAVTNVTLHDYDGNYGLDGRDITIAWTPAVNTDFSFDRYEIFLLPEGTQLDFNTHYPIDNIYSGQYQYDANGNALSTFTYTGGQFIGKDSANAALASSTYVAYILAFDYYGNKSATAQSSAAPLSLEDYDAGDDQTSPYIMHMGVWSAATGSALHLVARADDDRMIDASHPLQMVWKAGTDFSFNLSSGATTDDCTLVQANFYDCEVAWNAGWDDSYVIGYYLKALDDAGNYAYMSADPDADMSGSEAQVKYHPFYIDLMPVNKDVNSDPDLGGTTYKSNGNILASTTIFFEGMAIAPVTSNASGTFAFPDNILDYGMYHAMAVKDGYMTMVNDVYRGGSVSFYLNEGDVGMSGGAGDSGANPIVMWTAPFDNMSGAPIDIYCTGDCLSIGAYEKPIIIAFDRPMNSSTINDQNAADSSSNIYLTSNGLDRVSGKVRYDSVNQQAIFYAGEHDTLSFGTYYSIVVTQGVTDEYGSPIQGMNSDGSFSNGFTTIMSTITDFDNFGTGGDTMPPYVMGVTPYPGQFNVSRNTSVIIQFSEPMDSAKISSNTIQLIPVTNSASWILGSPVPATVSLDQTTKKIATLNPDADLDNSVNWWVVKVKGDARSSSGMYLADPMGVGGCSDYTVCSELNSVTAHESSFQINTGDTDTTKPTVNGTYPNNNDGITNSSYVDVGIGAVEIGFSEAMDPNTINANNIKLLAGSSVTGGKVSYDPMSNGAKFMSYSALLANTQYTLRVSVNCTDLSGNQLNATTTKYFKTGSADTQAPELMYANGDDYSIAITFNEPMKAAKQTDTTNWPYSVLNPANYAVNALTMPDGCTGWGCTPTSRDLPYDTEGGVSLSGLGLSFSYEDYNNTVIVKGFQFNSASTDFQVFVDNVRDRSNNQIADSGYRATSTDHLKNAARASLYSSSDTYGALVPGAEDYTMDMGDMGMMMAGAFPMNAMAGQNSVYFIDIPTTKSIPIGGKIVITFPSGFDVSAAAEDPYAPINNDINEWNTGQVTIHSVTGNQSARTVTIIASTSATQAMDYLHMDIKGIVNSNIPKGFGTEGYRVDIKTFTDDGVLLETISTMPFYISTGGALSISGNIDGLSAGSGDSGAMSVYLGSPMTGPMEAEVILDENNTPDGTYSFNNLPDGEYYIFTDPAITVSGNDYYGSPHSEPIRLSGSSTTKDIDLSPASSGGAAVTVSLTGNFSTDGAADDVDVFAGSPTGFRVKKLSGVGSVNGTTTTLYLSQGSWMIGIGPSIPQNVSGPPPMTDWMPPANVYYYSDGATPGNVSFNISGQTANTVSGTVVDGSGNGIADAEVYAYQPMGGYGGSFTKTATDGTFTLKIPVLGTYMIGAHKPGLPEPKEKYVDVASNVSGLVIKITKPAYTISGQVLNSSGSAIAYAPVWAWQESGWGHSDTMSDASGNYILYVNYGTWHVEADAPGIGWMEYELPVTTNATNTANINISPNADTSFYTISGQVGISTDSTYSVINTPFANMPIRAVQYSSTTGAYLGKEFNAMTNSNGEYTISVPAGAYRVDIWTQEYGELGVNNQAPLDNTLNESGVDDKYADNRANVDASSGNVTSANIVVAQTGLNNVYIAVSNAPASQEGYLNIEGVDFSGDDPEPNGFQMFRRIADLSATTTVKLANGDYFFFLDVPGYGTYIPDASDRHAVKDDIVVSATTTIHFTLPDASSEMVTVSGTIYSGSEVGGNELENAWVWIGNPGSGYHNGTQSASDGTYSLTIPAGTGYRLGADKPGYMSKEPSSLNAGADSGGNNIVLTQQGYTISGHIYADADSNSAYDAGEGVPSGFVRAETTECGDSDTTNDADCVRSHAPVDGSGAYELGVVNGVWKVYGMADGYTETEYGSNITISGSSASGKNIKLTAKAGWTTKSKKKSITPSSGGSLDDTDPAGTGIKLTIPPNALGSSNSSGDVNAQKTSSVTQTNSSDPVGGEGVTVSATDNSGQSITNLDDYIDIEMVLYKSEIDAAIAAEELTYAKLKNTKNAYWDSTTNDWVNLATTRKAYYKGTSNDTEWTLYASSTANLSAFENFINQIASSSFTVYDYKLVFSSKTNHLTVFAVIMPFIAVPAQAGGGDPGDPIIPPSGGGGSYINYCTSVEYGEWGECTGGIQRREVISRISANCTLTTSQQIGQQRECVFEEEETSESTETETVSMTEIDQLYLEQGEFIARADVEEIMPALGITVRNHEGERLSRTTLMERLGINLGDYDLRVQYALTNFITYGSPDTYRLGWGERAGVLNSFMAAFGKVAQTADDWSDIIKIANGRWPTQRSEQAENRATEHFRKIYLREPDRNNPHDDAAVTVIAYGLRPANRNMDSEAVAVRIFKAIYGYAPAGATDWDVVRAIAYSGAVR